MSTSAYNGYGPLIVSVLVFVFSGFLLFITKGQGGLDTAAVALCGPLVGAVVAYFFHSEGVGQSAAIAGAGVAQGLAAASGQPTSTTTGSSSFATGSAASHLSGTNG